MTRLVAAKAVLDFRIGEPAHLDKSGISKWFTKAPSTIKFKHEENDIVKIQRISRGNEKNWYLARDLKDFPSRYTKGILDSVYDHAKKPE